MAKSEKADASVQKEPPGGAALYIDDDSEKKEVKVAPVSPVPEIAEKAGEIKDYYVTLIKKCTCGKGRCWISIVQTYGPYTEMEAQKTKETVTKNIMEHDNGPADGWEFECEYYINVGQMGRYAGEDAETIINL